MLILPDRHIPRARVLMPLPRASWLPSQRARIHGIENAQYWIIDAVTSDGVRYWRGCFEDRDDADAFLWAMARTACGEKIPRDIARLPQRPSGPHLPLWCHWFPAKHYGEWRPDFIDLPLRYEFLSADFVTTIGSSTYTSKGDWTNTGNFVFTVGAGASGGTVPGTGHGTGGGAGACNSAADFSFAVPGVTTAAVNVGAGGAAVAHASILTNGNDGGDTWFNGANLAASTVGSKGGVKGVAGTGSQNGGLGGAAASGTGTAEGDGGRGGNLTGASGSGGSGGAGAGGPDGNGNQGVDSSSTTGGVTTNGGTSNAGSDAGGTAGAGGNDGGAGGNGSTWDASHGLGGGAGGSNSNGAVGGAGGLYGGAGGGARGGVGTITSGAGRQGMIVLLYVQRNYFFGEITEARRMTRRTRRVPF